MPLMSIAALSVDGTTLPQPRVGGMKISEEKVWSKNTGRSAAASMVGTILAIKTTIEIKWPPLTPAQVAIIKACVSSQSTPFHSLSFTDETGQTRTINAYFSTPSYSCFEIVGGQWRITDVSVSAIEQ